VAAVITASPGVTDAVVYGVTIPNTDGRAGMAALVVDAGFNLDALRRHVFDRLPTYARPLFLRLVAAIELTGTFKLNKQKLAREGYDPASITDTLYFYDKRSQAYVSLETGLYERIRAGAVAL